jgi:acyl carrier protein
MNGQKFVSDIEQMLEIDAGGIDLTTVLANMEKWDSLAFVSFIALAHSKYGAKIAPKDLRDCITINDLMLLTQKSGE